MNLPMDTAAGPVVLIDGERMAKAVIIDRAARLAQGLASLGVKAGSAVSLLLHNDFACLYAGLAARYLGAHVVLLNNRSKESELGYIMQDSDPDVVIGHADLLWNVRAVLPDVPTLVLQEPGGSHLDRALAGIRGAVDGIAFIARHEPITTQAGGATEAIIYTSGTTGRPKGVRRLPLDAGRAAANRAAMSDIFGIRSGSRVLALGPLYHSLPDTASKLGLELADLLIIQRKFDPEETLRQIDAHRITELTLVPTMFVRLLKLPQEVRDRYDVSSLRTVTHTGAPCPVEVKRAMIAWWGPIFHELYGATEVGVTFFADSSDWLHKPGTVGRPMADTMFAILDESGAEVEAGTPGEIFARNAIAPDWEYIGHPRDGRADGLTSVGDIGYVDEDGYLFLCDRKNDMIISGGVNIYPAEIEAVVLGHPGVFDCAVFGAPHAEMGEQIVLAVALVEGAQVEADELREFVRDRMTSYKVPRVVDFHAALPRQESGKILRRALREPYWQGQTARI